MAEDLSIDPRPEAASTLPSRLYTDPAYAAIERETIFARTWQLAGRAEQVREDGDYFTADVAGEPIVVVRDGATLRAFYNVCRHRAGPVATGCGRRKTLQCRYHGWTYALSGSLLRAPEMEGTSDFEPANVHLPAVRVEAFGPMVFVNLDPLAPPLAEFLGDMPARMAHTGLGAMRYVAAREYVIACNWKVYVDNYLEGYHLPVVHPGLHRELDYGAYRVEPARYYSAQHAPMRPVQTDASGAGRKYVPSGDQQSEAQYFWLFPNVMVNVYLGQMQTNVIVPLGHDRTRTVFEWYATAPPADPTSDPAWASLESFSDEIQREDIEICEVVQRNLGSRSYDRGRFSARRENGVHHFHSLVAEFLARRGDTERR